MHYVPAPLALRGFESGFDSSRAQNPDSQRLRKRFFYARKQAFLLRMCTRHMHYVPAPLALRGFNPGFISSLGILGFSGCIRGFFMPKNGCVGSRIPATLSNNVLSITFPSQGLRGIINL